MHPLAQRSPDVEHVARQGGVALLPIGATEQHGPHLPIATDAIIAEALAARAADRLPAQLPAWLLPVLAYGLSPEHSGRPGTVSLSTTALHAVCLDIARAVAASGIRTLVFVNAHGGNPDLLRVLARDIREHVRIDAFVVHAPVLPLPAELTAAMPRPAIDVHAGFYETSVLLALGAEGVRPDLAAPDGLRVEPALRRMRHISLFGEVSLPWHIDDLSASGTVGDPTGASADWGRAALDAQSQALAETIVELVTFRYPPTDAPGGAR